MGTSLPTFLPPKLLKRTAKNFQNLHYTNLFLLPSVPIPVPVPVLVPVLLLFSPPFQLLSPHCAPKPELVGRMLRKREDWVKGKPKSCGALIFLVANLTLLLSTHTQINYDAHVCVYVCVWREAKANTWLKVKPKEKSQKNEL